MDTKDFTDTTDFRDTTDFTDFTDLTDFIEGAGILFNGGALSVWSEKSVRSVGSFFCGSGDFFGGRFLGLRICL